MPGKKTQRFTSIQLQLFSFDAKSLEKACACIKNSTDSAKIFLPRKRTLYTVLRSPHIDKKSREQFVWTRKKRSIFLTGTPNILLENLKNGSFAPQVQILIKIKHYVNIYGDEINKR
uniref:Ribosomal protein S10 n=1 Tax=Mesostigma viride TaxID=41882 RepID=Q8W9Q1_MESVI|nr:ribosomal protein S10 [Mesostigma viride]AAL36757.1 ribosomal protein S10 [Mesostigma viride]